ncbi:hypothetical protein ACGFSD_28530 [Streptomyces caniferus]|uniref:hypothetical protein n=1 Tax=Streptomyces caniferus TaxID=285557 RepID=UPI00372179D2
MAGVALGAAGSCLVSSLNVRTRWQREPSCAGTGAFGDPDDCAVQAAAWLVPADRAARAKRYNSVVDTLGSVLKRVGDVAGL